MRGLIEGALEHLVEGLGKIHPRLRGGGFGQVLEQVARFGDYRVGVNAALFQDRPHDPFFLFRQGNQQVESSKNGDRQQRTNYKVLQEWKQGLFHG